MIATSVTYDLVFLIHIIAAVDTLIVLVVMRTSAQVVTRSAVASAQLARFPNRRNWAVRVIHVLPLTGLILMLSGGHSVALSRPWIIVGILCYLGAAGYLEARVLPQERALAQTIARDGTAPASGGRTLTTSIDVVLLLIGLALVSMLVQY